MPGVLADIGAVLAAHGLRYALGLLMLLGAAGGGFVWGESRATALVLKSATTEASVRVAAAQKQDRDVIVSYLNQLQQQKSRGDGLAASLAQTQSKLAAATAAARKALAHAVPDNAVCDLGDDAVGLLNAQPARH